MPEMPRVILLLSHQAGYDRAIIQGVVRYSRIHGPWNLCLAGAEPGLPLPEMEAFSGKPIATTGGIQTLSRTLLPNLRRWNAKGIIGRIQN
jgi:LacI family transcriptional regulator